MSAKEATVEPLENLDPGARLDKQLDKEGATIQDMFAEVAPRYDLLNHLLSGWLDKLWRRRAARALEIPAGGRVLDLCSGTGDQAVAIRRRHSVAVVAGDFCLPMLSRARAKFDRLAPPRPRNLLNDALAAPFAESVFDAVSVSFGLRNVSDLEAALAEIHRVLKPGGQAVFLEFAMPRRQPVRAAYGFYFRRILPNFGRLLSNRPAAYRYLPDSVVEFPQRGDFSGLMERAGFGQCSWLDLSLGTVCLYQGKAL